MRLTGFQPFKLLRFKYYNLWCAAFVVIYVYKKKRKLNWYFLGKGELTTYWLCGKDDYDRPLPNWEAEDGPSHGLKIDDYLNVSSI